MKPIAALLLMTLPMCAQEYKIAIIGMVHSHVWGHLKPMLDGKDAKLVGDIRTARIIIEDGAYFKGSIDIVKPEPGKAPAKPVAAAPAVATHAPAVAGAPDIRR